jgi:hypothetical protein
MNVASGFACVGGEDSKPLKIKLEVELAQLDNNKRERCSTTPRA